MTEYARVEGNTIIERRTLTSIPEHKAHLWRPVVYEGDGSLSDIHVEAGRVRVVRWAPPITATQVKLECRNRILARFPDWKQTNMLARAVELQNIWRLVGKWADSEAAEAAALDAAWAWIKATRAASDEIERLDPILADYTDGKRWPA